MNDKPRLEEHLGWEMGWEMEWVRPVENLKTQ